MEITSNQTAQSAAAEETTEMAKGRRSKKKFSFIFVKTAATDFHSHGVGGFEPSKSGAVTRKTFFLIAIFLR